MTVRYILTVCVVGFVGCAEFGSWAFVHPVLRRLPPTYWLQVEQGLLRTFGRVMPVGMTAAPILAGSTAAGLGRSATLGWMATAALGLALVTTIVVNVGINLDTGRWDPDHPPDYWQDQRARWETFQGVRACLQLAGFVLIVTAVVIR